LIGPAGGVREDEKEYVCWNPSLWFVYTQVEVLNEGVPALGIENLDI